MLRWTESVSPGGAERKIDILQFYSGHKNFPQKKSSSQEGRPDGDRYSVFTERIIESPFTLKDVTEFEKCKFAAVESTLSDVFTGVWENKFL